MLFRSQTGYNYYTSCTGKGDTLAFTGLKSDADGVLTVEVAANANTTSAVQVSFIMVSGEVKTPEPAPETKTKVVKDTLTKDNIPQGIKDKGYDTPEKITEAFKKAISKNQSADNIEVYDVKLMISTDNGAHWSEATDANFPAGGIDVTFDLPKGITAANYDQFSILVSHMKDSGEVELLTPTLQNGKLVVHVTELSPFAVSWTAKAQPSPVPTAEPDRKSVV